MKSGSVTVGRERSPFIAISNEELDDQPELAIGDVLFCAKCSDMHQVTGVEVSKTGVESNVMLFVKHDDGSSLMVGADGKYIGSLPVENVD